jgi:hypothetical protein
MQNNAVNEQQQDSTGATRQEPPQTDEYTPSSSRSSAQPPTLAGGPFTLVLRCCWSDGVPGREGRLRVWKKQWVGNGCEVERAE